MDSSSTTNVITILYDHIDFVIVNKPPHISVQNESGQQGILPMLCQQWGLSKLWLVHRLDKVTSGILILTKNAQTAAIFGQLFEHKQIEKYYLALSNKKPKKKQGSVKGGMKKIRDGKWILDHSDINFAHTQFFSFSSTPGTRLFIVKPLTGKTHQIRVALKSIGAPIIGDKLYTGSTADRTYLHAFCIRFMYRDELITISCPAENGEHFTHPTISKLISHYHQPWLLNWPKSPNSKLIA